jgi:hypothetical protein
VDADADHRPSGQQHDPRHAWDARLNPQTQQNDDRQIDESHADVPVDQLPAEDPPPLAVGDDAQAVVLQ